MTPEECVRRYEFHDLVRVDSGTENLEVRVCLRCHAEFFMEMEE